MCEASHSVEFWSNNFYGLPHILILWLLLSWKLRQWEKNCGDRFKELKLC